MSRTDEEVKEKEQEEWSLISRRKTRPDMWSCGISVFTGLKVVYHSSPSPSPSFIIHHHIHQSCFCVSCEFLNISLQIDFTPLQTYT